MSIKFSYLIEIYHIFFLIEEVRGQAFAGRDQGRRLRARRAGISYSYSSEKPALRGPLARRESDTWIGSAPLSAAWRRSQQAIRRQDGGSGFFSSPLPGVSPGSPHFEAQCASSTGCELSGLANAASISAISGWVRPALRKSSKSARMASGQVCLPPAPIESFRWDK